MNRYNNLDLDKVKEEVAFFASIEETKSYLLNEEVSFNPLQIRKNASLTKEALDLLRQDFSISFDGIICRDELFHKAEKGIMLTAVELRDLLVFHNHCNRIRKLFSSYSGSLSLCDYTDSISTGEKIFNEIEDCIDSSGQIKEDATEKLKQLNQNLNQCEKNLYNKAYTFIDKHPNSLQEQSFYLRNDRITFLIKSSDKNKYQGYTYGSSASGLAYYVEPSSFIDLNNEKIRLLQDIEEEKQKILLHLTYLISSVSEDYCNNFESVMLLCGIFAKAFYGMKYLGIIPEFTDNRYFDFKDLCHPLIDPQKVVSNSYRLFSPYQGIVISGSNTGGKTVSLKAIGLSILMSYLGIPIIASSAKIPFYRNIYVDIDDNQSIQDSLSTFSAHITNINQILKQSDANSLILIDELISGTDPKEAQAISLAILDQIKKIGSIFIVTTHFDDIKNYSYEDKEILLSSVGFDMDKLTPTYHYLEDSIGSSNALEIASRYFDDPQIIENARNYLKKSQNTQEEMLEKLSHQYEENEKERMKLQESEKQLKEKISVYEDMISQFDKEKAKLKQDYQKKLNKELEEIRQLAIEKLESIHDSKQKNIVKQIEELKNEEKIEVPEKRILQVNDNVRIKENEHIGIITAISGNNATVNIRGLTVKAKLDDLHWMPKTVKKESKVISKKYQRVPSELNVIGNRVEDALPVVEEYLDKANAAHMTSVKVIHGIGTGILRAAIRDRLKKLSYVKSFKDGDYYDGGSAVTMVEFR